MTAHNCFFEHAHTFTDMSLEDFHRQCTKDTYDTTQFLHTHTGLNTAITMNNYLVKTLHEIKLFLSGDN